MKSAFVRTWVVVLLAVGIGGYAYFVESKRPATDVASKEKVFGSLSADQIAELTLGGEGREPIHLVKQGDAWRLTEPMDVEADGSEVESLVNSFVGLELDAVVAEGPVDLAPFGLDEPGVVVEALPRGATEPLKLMLGDDVPAGGGLYARVPSQARVFTVASFLKSSFDKKPFDLRDRDLLKVKRDAIRTLTIDGPEGRLALAREPGGEQWRFTAPVATRAGRWPVDGLLGGLENLRMDAIAADQPTPADLKKFGLAPAQRRVTMGLGEDAEKVLEIGSATDDGKYHARAGASGVIAVIPDTLVKDLERGLDGLRSKRIIDAATYQVVGFDVTRNGATRTYARSGGDEAEHKWKRTAPDAQDLETDPVQDALYKLGGINASSFVDAPGPPSDYGLDAPELRIELREEGKAAPEWVEIARKDGVVYARRADDAAVLKLEAKDVDELIADLEKL